MGSAPLLAQEPAPAITAEEAIAIAEDRWSILVPEVNPCAVARDNADPDVIVVCREWEDGERYTFDAPTRADSRVTGSGAPRPPDFDESCLRNRGRENCMMFGKVPPPAIMVDFDSLPETPADSEAARLYGGPTDADQPPGD
ncbi:hypothetical protein M3P36_02095 [Altererythrobacter sp. KTW20L]|uniref:hypothetical protein n=1 Tax=Altererythrobacter sp. KTW20L TaxID=2942210 RepID=UPI0020C02037|nr:hypothetical protein [Altererythrobacter sp. KTW20L]MCL6249841.1 hypothetical protein [Altererythrobacter sp. KTW20L]